ncbi:hypothetical protein FE257_010191 [Aspergillus nanangensis]|uniref:Major facilitator superfamily (MFS) profile domain-containing protein n=1 Tax=Aspergillus nanangensis TaxID=2582783 RepID=A0AAD4GRI8_ASPNN|nr:hypothetical protein FE257_010191 [Aspergillus nanangensis]
MALEPDSDPETQPLLGHNAANKAVKNKGWVLLLVSIVIVTIELGDYLSIAPRTQILESIICRRFYPSQVSSFPLDDSRCKSFEVQAELAFINGWKDTLDALPCILLTLPFGFMADRVGRKKVALMSMGGMVMEEIAIRIICWFSEVIPPRAIWLTPLFQICGGGNQVAGSMVFTIITDIFPIEKRVNAFYIVSAAVLLAEVLATPLSAWMMSRSLWVPFLLGALCEVCGLLAALAIPETLSKSVEHADDDTDGGTHEDDVVLTNWRQSLRNVWSQIIDLTEFIWGNMNNLAISLAFLTASVGRQSLQLMIQYVSKRFSWSMAEASFLISLKGAINLVGLLVLLPMISRYLQRYLSPVLRDLRLTQASAVILVTGFSIMAFASNPASFAVGVSLSALGWGFYSTLRSVATALVDEGQNGILNTTIGLVQGIGAVTAGPLLANAFRYGMTFDGVFLGLPYMVAAFLFVLAIWATFTIHIPSIGV